MLSVPIVWLLTEVGNMYDPRRLPAKAVRLQYGDKTCDYRKLVSLVKRRCIERKQSLPKIYLFNAQVAKKKSFSLMSVHPPLLFPHILFIEENIKVVPLLNIDGVLAHELRHRGAFENYLTFSVETIKIFLYMYTITSAVEWLRIILFNNSAAAPYALKAYALFTLSNVGLFLFLMLLCTIINYFAEFKVDTLSVRDIKNIRPLAEFLENSFRWNQSAPKTLRKKIIQWLNFFSLYLCTSHPPALIRIWMLNFLFNKQPKSALEKAL